MMTGIFIPVVRFLIIVPFVVLTAMALAALALIPIFGDTLISGISGISGIFERLFSLGHRWSAWHLLLFIFSIYAVSIIMLAFALAPIILLLGIYEEMQKQSYQLQYSTPLLLTKKARRMQTMADDI